MSRDALEAALDAGRGTYEMIVVLAAIAMSRGASPERAVADAQHLLDVARREAPDAYEQHVRSRVRSAWRQALDRKAGAL